MQIKIANISVWSMDTPSHTHIYNNTSLPHSRERFDNVTAPRPKSSLKEHPAASSQHLVCAHACVFVCALLRPTVMKAACGDKTSFTMTPNAPWRTVDALLFMEE